MKKYLITLFVAIFLAGCANHIGRIDGSKLADLKIGMDKAEVLKVLGKPQSASADGQIETYHYWEDHGNWRHVYHVLVFKSGKLDSFQLAGASR